MSEQAKLAYVQERLKEARNRERFGDIFLGVGIILAIIFFSARF